MALCSEYNLQLPFHFNVFNPYTLNIVNIFSQIVEKTAVEPCAECASDSETFRSRMTNILDVMISGGGKKWIQTCAHMSIGIPFAHWICGVVSGLFYFLSLSQ